MAEEEQQNAPQAAEPELIEVPLETPASEGETPADASAAAPAEPVKPEPVKPRGPRIPLPSSLQEIVGALLFASESPLTESELRACVRGVAPTEDDDAEVMSVYQSCTTREISQALRGLEKELKRSGCGFQLVCSGGAYRLQTSSTCGRYVRALLKLDRPSRLSRASLETLAIIAYRQPITKAEIEQIRGVAVDTIVKSLVDLQLVRLVGRSELPGHPFLYGTSPIFLEHFGLSSLSELNEIDPTLQRSNPRERAKLFVKEKKPEQPTLEDAAKEPDAVPAADVSAAAAPVVPEEDASETTADGQGEGETAGEVRPRRVSFRPDEDELIDDTPDEVLDEDDESLTDDDDESLTDDDDESLTDDDDESLTDDDDDESLTDDEDDDEEDDDDEDESEEGGEDDE